MHISRVGIRNVRGFTGTREVALDLARPDGTCPGWIVIAGRNGSGKTTLLRAIGLAVAGPFELRSLVPDQQHWRSHGTELAQVELHAVLDDGAEITLDFEDHSGVPVWGASPGDQWPQRQLSAALCVGYGPFRRLVGGSNGAQRLAAGTGQAARLATLFHEEASLAEGVSWLIDQHLRALEKKPGAEQLKRTALEIMQDGLLPDGYDIMDVDSDGLWVRRGKDVFPLREMSDGFRAVSALVLDLLKQIHTVFGTLPVARVAEGLAVTSPGVVLIDEVDAHLHVSWQRRIGVWLKAHFPNIQFIVTTHSPYVCQSADPGGLIALPGPDDSTAPRVVGDDLYARVVYGSGDDAALSELFGIESLYSERANDLREELVQLEFLVREGNASPAQVKRFAEIRDTLTSSPATRVAEVAAMFLRSEAAGE